MTIVALWFLVVDLESDNLNMSSKWRREGEKVYVLGSDISVCVHLGPPSFLCQEELLCCIGQLCKQSLRGLVQLVPK